MHIVISWDISEAGEKHAEINDKLRTAFEKFSWVRPLTTFYVVRISSESERISIRDQLVEIAKSVPQKVHIVVSPTMAGGRYDGYLPKDMWEKLNKRSDP
ncbi:hypothetical protein FMZ60_11400 [Alcaligenaceae bacterium SJ-26]|nr:hypothetical protein FMZ60_11400 [Alcaligenaceae bacterium SJ-26]